MRLPTFYEQNLIPNWGIKDKKESTLLKQKGFTCVCVTVLFVVVLIVKHWRNRQSSS